MFSQIENSRQQVSRVAPTATAEQVDYRFHLHQGPIDLVIDLRGDHDAVTQAQQRAQMRFRTILEELVQELHLLRQPVTNSAPETELPHGSVARRMWFAANEFNRHFITPMAAVAGAVADEVLHCLSTSPGLLRIIINNGGDIALWGVYNQTFDIGLIDKPVPRSQRDVAIKVTFSAKEGVHGVATSGWRGRSQSLGIADAVTVFAKNAAIADAAATLIANEVNVESSAVIRAPAKEYYPDSDLGTRLVTVGVLELAESEIEQALLSGAAFAKSLCSNSKIFGAFISLKGHYRTCGCAQNRKPCGGIGN